MIHFFRTASFGDLTSFKNLLKDFQMKEGSAEAVLNARDPDGLTILHYAAAGGKTQIVKFLVEEAKLEVDIKDFNSNSTPLHHAIFEEHLPTAVYLLEKGADPNAATTKGYTPLHYAAEHGPKKLIELLISRGAEINAMADCGTPLQYAVGKRKKEFVKVLLDHHANPNLISRDQYSPLLLSIVAKSIECTKMLLKAGADPNIHGSEGIRTPLGIAASEGDTEVVKCLLNAGADPNVTNNEGLTPVELAALTGTHQDVMILFPVTSPVPSVPEWSVSGLIKHVDSHVAREERERKSKELFLLYKSKGAEAFDEKDYFGATQWYTEAHFINPTDATVLSNRSLCYSRMNEGELALEDAQDCIKLRPDWPKAYYRAGSAWMVLKEFEKAVDAFYHGWKMDKENKEIERAFR
ncbi:hypothetical protein SLE2022_246030 [Rubroshorea leprosula]